MTETEAYVALGAWATHRMLGPGRFPGLAAQLEMGTKMDQDLQHLPLITLAVDSYYQR